MTSEELVEIFSSLSDKNRLAIYLKLLSSKELLTPVVISRLLNLPDKLVSKALVSLDKAKLLTSLHQGRNTFYLADIKIANELSLFFKSLGEQQCN